MDRDLDAMSFSRQPAQTLLDFTEALNEAHSLQDGWQHLVNLLKEYGLSNGTYASFTELRSGKIRDDMVFISNHRSNFLSDYIDNGMIEHDYSVSYCREGGDLALWSTIRHQYPNAKRALFNEIVEGHGLKEGFTLPLPSFSPLIVSGVGFKAEDGSEAEAMRLLSEHKAQILRFCWAFEAWVKSPRVQRDAHGLSPREVQCLALICAGKLTKEIADHLGLADKTVEHYLANAIRKLRCRNRHHAAAKATLLGVILD